MSDHFNDDAGLPGAKELYRALSLSNRAEMRDLTIIRLWPV